MKKTFCIRFSPTLARMDSYKLSYKLVLQRAIVRRALRSFVKGWKKAYYDRKEQWFNRCTDCEKPLTSPLHRWRQCQHCTWRRECDDNGTCWRCQEEGITTSLTHHKCPSCDCPFNTNAVCLCPEPDYMSEEEEFIPCGRCGRDCQGGDYETLHVCSRSCLLRA
jgi:hypothetical protein